MIPTIQTIEGQGGNISIFAYGFGQMTIQVRNWQIRKTFRNADVTVTCSGGWARIQAGPGVLGVYRRLAV